MTDDRLLLHVDAFWISPYAFSSFLALREKGLPFEVSTVALHEKQQDQTAYRDRSVTGRVPSLQHGDFMLAESSAIAEYLEEVFPPPRYPRLFPETPRARARARQVMAWLRSDLPALRDERSAETMFYDRKTAPLGPAAQAAADKLVRVASALLPTGETTLFGPWCLADSELAFMLQRLLLNGHDAPAPVRRFVEAQWRRPNVREFVERDRLSYVPY